MKNLNSRNEILGDHKKTLFRFSRLNEMVKIGQTMTRKAKWIFQVIVLIQYSLSQGNACKENKNYLGIGTGYRLDSTLLISYGPTEFGDSGKVFMKYDFNGYPISNSMYSKTTVDSITVAPRKGESKYMITYSKLILDSLLSNVYYLNSKFEIDSVFEIQSGSDIHAYKNTFEYSDSSETNINYDNNGNLASTKVTRYTEKGKITDWNIFDSQERKSADTCESKIDSCICKNSEYQNKDYSYHVKNGFIDYEVYGRYKFILMTEQFSYWSNYKSTNSIKKNPNKYTYSAFKTYFINGKIKNDIIKFPFNKECCLFR